MGYLFSKKCVVKWKHEIIYDTNICIILVKNAGLNELRIITTIFQMSSNSV